ncbi:hypothetical protein SAMN05720469_1201 [Fibrobacter intestinalis]|uniref:Uncharacterized protein n=1 Tax=Fibrobacter intestinalis TaxID=28122 RepID=A0A1M6VQW7_9BACT|nr:hypothetical protein SAMN05720469_1201 [Fibrobacter intestinalis]
MVGEIFQAFIKIGIISLNLTSRFADFIIYVLYCKYVYSVDCIGKISMFFSLLAMTFDYIA